MNQFLLIVAIFIMTISGTFGALFFKKAMTKIQDHRFLSILWESQLYLGGAFYLLGALLNILLLRHIPYSILYPMTSLTYIWTMTVSYFVLDEKINREKIIAVVLIIFGVIILNM